MGPDGRSAPLSRLQAVCGTGTALHCRVAGAVARARRLAVGGVQEPASGPLGRLEAGVALPAAAPDREQHPVCDLESAGGFSSSRLLGAGRDDAASESGLAGSLRTPVADRGELRRPGPLPGDPLPSGELALSGQHPGVCAAQRPLHRPARQAEAALCLPAAAQRTAASARPAPAATSLGAEGT